MLYIPILLAIFGILSSLLLDHYIKRILALNIAQAGIILFFIMLAFNPEGEPPVLQSDATQYSNPLPHTLMLTAIVVSTATTFLLISLYKRHD